MIKIPMSSPDVGEAERDAVARVAASGSLSMGPCVDEFERRLASTLGAPHAAAVSSGTAGLHLCIIAAGVTDGDLVITSPFSFVSSANCILYERGVPIFVDVDPATGNIDPARVAEAVSALRQGRGDNCMPPVLRGTRPAGALRAILPVHTFGVPAEIEPLVALAKREGLAVIEDACEAIGASYRGHPVGTHGDAAVFAFYPNKQMTTGEGGMVVTGRADWDALFRSLRNQGRDVGDTWLTHSRLGFNYRLDEMSAVMGLVQIERLEELLARRERVARWYDERLRTVEGIVPRATVPGTTRSWFVYTVRLDPGQDRTAVMQRLEQDGIPSRPYFTPIHLQPIYRERFGFREGDFPVAEALGRQTLALPFSGVMEEWQVDYVCDRLAEALKACMAGTTGRFGGERRG